ncbi:MAG: hypothetical protein ACTSO7_02305 [Candidatus Heimdallarchaeota archaeon]
MDSEIQQKKKVDSINFQKKIKDLIVKENYEDAVKLFKKIKKKSNSGKEDLLNTLKEMEKSHTSDDEYDVRISLACKMLRSDIIYSQRTDNDKNRKKMKKDAYNLAEEALRDCIKQDMVKLDPVISIADEIQREARMPFFMKYIFLKWYFWLPIAFLYAFGFVFKFVLNGKWDTYKTELFIQGLSWSIALILFLLVFRYYCKKYYPFQRKLLNRLQKDSKIQHTSTLRFVFRKKKVLQEIATKNPKDEKHNVVTHLARDLYSTLNYVLCWVAAIGVFVAAFLINFYADKSNWLEYGKGITIVGSVIQSIIEGLYGFMLCFFILMVLYVLYFFVRLPYTLDWNNIWIYPTEENRSGVFSEIINLLLEVVFSLACVSLFIITTVLVKTIILFPMNLWLSKIRDSIRIDVINWYVLAYILLPFFAALIILGLPLLVYNGKLRKYKYTKLAPLLKQRDNYLTMLTSDVNQQSQETDLAKLERVDYVIEKMDFLKPKAIQAAGRFKWIISAAPGLVIFIVEILVKLNII